MPRYEVFELRRSRAISGAFSLIIKIHSTFFETKKTAK
jgi:hypothetical protein